MNTKDYEKIVDFINQHNDQICHITTWQTWKKESKLVLLVMIELLDNDLLTDMNNKELWTVRNHILVNLTEYIEALNSGSLNKVIDLLDQVEYE